MKHGIAILTRCTSKDTEFRLIETLKSLKESGYSESIFIVDDGSPYTRDWSLITDVEIIKKPIHGGISRGKNTCIKKLMYLGIDVGFLADDDVQYKKEWWIPYLEGHSGSGIRHFSFAFAHKGYDEVEYNNYRVRKTHQLNGMLLTFTEEVISKVGGFQTVAVKWGLDHVNWTNRIVAAGLSPFFADVIDSEKYISSIPNADISTVSVEERKKCRGFSLPKLGRIKRPLLE